MVLQLFGSIMNEKKQFLLKEIQKLSQPKILVVGDLALDEMIYGDTERISREAPVLILQHTHTKLILGGASNAAHNASAINNGKVAVVGVIGDDFNGIQLVDTFKKAKIETKYIVKDKKRKTITKTRISGSCSQSVTQQIVRIDRQTNELVCEATEKKIIKNLEKAIPLCDAVIISDYHIGTLTQKIIDYAIELANSCGKVVVVDAQKCLENYKNVTSMTPNLPDTQKSVGFELKSDDDFKKAGKMLSDATKAKSILITCGDKGMVVYKNRKMTKIPVFNKAEVFDVTGAGDTVTAVYTLALAIGLEPEDAAVIGNVAASIVIKQFGCATASIKEIYNTLEKIEL
ncbi:MAG: D-glycero-beta-D-manno-heptose-7-phosphate kinase [Candidatus Melainabacteria bacterium]|nr:MAG: D-glycero-beta-D-manno-heptose-7-phosphate kinase [Candidatus Melainabacteria bacterium]